MQTRTTTITVESLAVYAQWSDARLLLAALRELPFTARADLDEEFARWKIPAIDELTVEQIEASDGKILTVFFGWFGRRHRDVLDRLHEEVCVKADYCANRESEDFKFWSDLILVIAGILGDLGFLSLSLVVVRRFLDRFCNCEARTA
jgi:hypothetical protein